MQAKRLLKHQFNCQLALYACLIEFVSNGDEVNECSNNAPGERVHTVSMDKAGRVNDHYYSTTEK